MARDGVSDPFEGRATPRHDGRRVAARDYGRPDALPPERSPTVPTAKQRLAIPRAGVGTGGANKLLPASAH